MRTLWIAVCLTACGFEGVEPTFDAGLDAGVVGADVAVADAAELAWSAPERLLALSSAVDDRFPTPSAGALAITFTRTEMAGSFFVNVPFRSQRASLDADFAPAIRLAPFGTVSVWDLEMRDDELEWFFWKGLGQLAVSSRGDTSAPWSVPVDIGVDGFSPSLSADARTLYFTTFDGEVNALARLDPSAAFGAPIAVGFAPPFAIDSIDISIDELTLLVTADPDSAAAGIYLATRPSRAQPFGDPVRIPALEGAYRDARFSAGDSEIFLTATLGASEEIYRSVLE